MMPQEKTLNVSGEKTTQKTLLIRIYVTLGVSVVEYSASMFSF